MRRHDGYARTEPLVLTRAPWVRFGDETVWCPGTDFDRLIPHMRIARGLGPIPGLWPKYPAALEQIEIRLGAFQRAVVLQH